MERRSRFDRRLNNRQFTRLLDLVSRLDEGQEEMVVEILRQKNELRQATGHQRPDPYHEPPEPPASAPVPARIPPRPYSGAPGAAVVPLSEIDKALDSPEWHLIDAVEKGHV
jgi:hypothetical protein